MTFSQILKYSIISLLFSTSTVFAREITYPNQSGIGDSSLGYSVLKLALSKSDKSLTIALDIREATPGRVVQMLTDGQIDVLDGGFSPDVAKQHQVIYLPIDMGLSGWRLFITHPDTSNKLSAVQSIEDLKKYTFGQGLGWYDTQILKSAGLTVITPPKLSNLFGMADSQRFDILPLGANEVFALKNKFSPKNSNLIIDNHLTLVYTFGRFFYVRKSDTELKHAIEDGLNFALEDGSLIELLRAHPYSKEAFDKAKLSERTQIRIETPELNKEFESIDPKWWYAP